MVSKKTFVKTILLIGCLFFIDSCSNFLNEQSGITGSAGENDTVAPEPTVAFYLDPIDGIDTNEGTEAAPVKTIEKAIELFSQGGGDLFVMGAINIKSDSISDITSWKSVDGKPLTLKRYLKYRHALIEITGGTLTLENITIDGNKANNVTAIEALITVSGSGAKLVLETGAILQNNNNTINNGGGVSVSNGGTVTINGGTITNNATTMNGGGISVSDNNDDTASTVTIKGGTITNNIAENGGGMSVRLGEVKLENAGVINISSNKKIDDTPNNIDYANKNGSTPIKIITDLENGTTIGLSPSNNAFRATLVEACIGIAITANHFTRDDRGGVATLDNNLIVSPIEVYLHPSTATTTEDGTEAAPVKTMNRAIALLGGVDVISSFNTIWVKDTIEVMADTDWNYNSLTLKRDISFKGVLINIADSTLTLENITIDGNKDTVTNAEAALIEVSDATAELVLNTGAKLQNNNNTLAAGGGGVHVADSGKVTINSGAIITNNESSGGGGVHIVDGTVTIDGGEIANNKSSGASSGGGLYVAATGKVTINGGAITNNKSSGATSGGGVYVAATGKVTITGGAITKNIAIMGGGGGLHVVDTGIVQLGKGPITISDNTVGSNNSNIFYNHANKPIEISSNIAEETKIGLSPSGLSSPATLVKAENSKIVYELDYFSLDTSTYTLSIDVDKNLIGTSAP